MFNNLHPGRPSVPSDAYLSARAKIEGFAENIRIGRGARIREAAWLWCMDSDSSIEIGSGTAVMPYAKLVAGFGGRLIVGKTCSIHSFDVLYGFTGGLSIGDGVRIGVHTMFISANHNIEDPLKGPNEQGFASEGIKIESGAWIGAGCKVLDGVTIGERAVVGAGSVVTRDIPANSVCVGVPARVIRTRRATEKP